MVKAARALPRLRRSCLHDEELTPRSNHSPIGEIPYRKRDRRRDSIRIRRPTPCNPRSGPLICCASRPFS